jgi:hypothetical protein
VEQKKALAEVKSFSLKNYEKFILERAQGGVRERENILLSCLLRV